MVSVTERRYPNGYRNWRVQARIDGRMRSRSFRTVDEAEAYARTIPQPAPATRAAHLGSVTREPSRMSRADVLPRGHD